MPDRYFLLGEKVANSPSPSMMNAAFEALGLEAEYQAIPVRASELRSAFMKLRTSRASGLNVTIPHKTSIMSLLDSADMASARIGAVNTVKSEGGLYRGYNSDVDGITESLRSRGFTTISRAFVLGTGGASRAFCEAMHELGCNELTALSRSPEGASGFLNSMRSSYPNVSIEVVSLDNIPSDAPEVFFNATPAGANGIPFPEQVGGVLEKRPIVFDAVYYPVETELVKMAKEKHCPVVYGHEMLLHQGLKSLQIWTGRAPPEEPMKAALLRSLGVIAA
jgi:shikimate dehydrogenase